MKRYVAVIGILGLVLWVGLSSSRADAQGTSLEGTWRLVETTTTGPDGSTFPPQAALAIYTPTHFAWLIDQSAGDGRPALSRSWDESTADQFRAMLDGFSGAAGTYELSGGELTWTNEVAPYPPLMAPGNFLKARVAFDGDTVKVTTYENQDGPFDNPGTFTMTRGRGGRETARAKDRQPADVIHQGRPLGVAFGCVRMGFEPAQPADQKYVGPKCVPQECGPGVTSSRFRSDFHREPFFRSRKTRNECWRPICTAEWKRFPVLKGIRARPLEVQDARSTQDSVGARGRARHAPASTRSTEAITYQAACRRLTRAASGRSKDSGPTSDGWSVPTVTRTGYGRNRTTAYA